MREWYALAGNRKDVWSKENRLWSVAKMEMEEDFNALVIYYEIQGNEYWGVRRRDLDLDDPPIYQFLEPARASPTTTAFAIQVLLHEAASSDNIVAVNNQGNHADVLQEVRRKFGRCDLPAHRFVGEPMRFYEGKDILIETGVQWLIVTARSEAAYEQLSVHTREPPARLLAPLLFGTNPRLWRR